jgi:hypothetical protein
MVNVHLAYNIFLVVVALKTKEILEEIQVTQQEQLLVV